MATDLYAVRPKDSGGNVPSRPGSMARAQAAGMQGGQAQYLAAQGDEAGYNAERADQTSRNAENDARVQRMMGSFGMGGGSAQPAQPAVPAQFSMPDTSQAEAAMFARAKDQAGETSRGALTALRSELGGTGMLGSGNESRGTASILNTGQKQMGDVIREQTIQRANNAMKGAEVGYQGAIQQRGQDIQAQSNQAQLNLERLKLALSSMGGMG
jgi:hypothetical protein